MTTQPAPREFNRWYKDRDFPEVKASNSDIVAVIERPKELERVIDEHNAALDLLRSTLAEVAELKRYKVAALSELLEFRSKIEIAQLALETEEKLCGRLYGTLGHALTTIRGGQ